MCEILLVLQVAFYIMGDIGLEQWSCAPRLPRYIYIYIYL